MDNKAQFQTGPLSVFIVVCVLALRPQTDQFIIKLIYLISLHWARPQISRFQRLYNKLNSIGPRIKMDRSFLICTLNWNPWGQASNCSLLCEMGLQWARPNVLRVDWDALALTTVLSLKGSCYKKGPEC